MARIYAAAVRDGSIEGNFVTLAGVNFGGDMEEFAMNFKRSRARLHDVELGDLVVYGPWATQPRVADVARLVGEEPCRIADVLGALVAGMERAYFLVRITAPPLNPVDPGACFRQCGCARAYTRRLVNGNAAPARTHRSCVRPPA